MQDNLIIKEEVASPVESIPEFVFDNFELTEYESRKFSCSSNDSISSLATSSDSGYGAICDVSERRNSSILNQMKQKADSSLVQRNLELHLSSSQKENIQTILDSVKKLSDTEKLLLYLKLPAKDQEHPITLSNTKQEQTLAFQWIRNNLEECDGNTNLPKHEVYDQYRSNCESQGSKRYLSAPDFGKIVKCMFPNVKARRLGTRGNSKYCYSGLRRKVLKESPILPHISESSNGKMTKETPSEKLDSTDQTFAAACVVVCEWANKLLGRFFTTIVELAKFLVDGSYVSTKSMGAFTVMSASQEMIEQSNTRFGLEALLKSTGNPKSEMNKPTKKAKTNCTPSKTMKTSTPVSSPMSQVVPQTPTKTVGSLHQHKQDPCFEFTMDPVNGPVFLEETSHSHASSDRQNVLLDDVTVIVAGNSFVSQSNQSNACTNAIGNHQSPHQSPHTPKKGKKKPEKIPIPISKHYNTSDVYCDVPNSAPPIGLKTPKKVGRPRSAKKQNSSPYPPQSPRHFGGSGAIISPRYGSNVSHKYPISNMNINGNRYPSNWPSPSVDNELHNIFLNSRYANTPPNLQRCHSVPVPQNNNNPTDFYHPLTPQLQTLPHAMNGQVSMYKAKRDLTSLFDQKSLENPHRNFQPDLSMSREMSCPNNNFQNDERLVPTAVPMNPNNLAASCQPTNFPRKEPNTFQTMDDLNIILSDITNPVDLLDIPTNFEQVDSDELLKSLQTNENIWANEWNTATIPLLNV